VEALLPGVKIDRVVVLDFNAFAGMVDMVGGVELNVPRRMYYKDEAGGLYIDLKPGRQVLDGSSAVGFVRYRKGDDDFHRQDRQKDFMLAFKTAAMKRPAQLPQVAQKAREVMGGALNDEEVASLVLFARAVGNDNIDLGMLPTVPTRSSNLRVNRSARDKTLVQYGLIERQPVRVSSNR
jgi:anionic cell wall polymer biosynthesis LytR-Cps2A-Psr (LCP) family protein